MPRSVHPSTEAAIQMAPIPAVYFAHRIPPLVAIYPPRNPSFLPPPEPGLLLSSSAPPACSSSSAYLSSILLIPTQLTSPPAGPPPPPHPPPAFVAQGAAEVSRAHATAAPTNPRPRLTSRRRTHLFHRGRVESNRCVVVVVVVVNIIILAGGAGLPWRADPPELGLISSFAGASVTEQTKSVSRANILIVMEAGRTDQPCMAAINSQPLVPGVEAVKKSSGDMPTTMGSGCFDCNICLDFAAEPVVTLCGHLYCWPCIYEWLRPGVESTASDNSSSARRQCPVCKATLSPDTLVPLYGRGGSSKKSLNGVAIPRRPMVHRETVEHQNAQSNADDQHHNQSMEANPLHQPLRHTHYHPNPAGFDFIYPPAPLGRGLIHSTAGGVLGGMAEAVLPLVLRGQLPASLYYTSPYHVAAQNVNPRQRRHQMEIERSLHQIWFFLFVFVVLCLLLF